MELDPEEQDEVRLSERDRLRGSLRDERLPLVKGDDQGQEIGPSVGSAGAVQSRKWTREPGLPREPGWSYR